MKGANVFGLFIALVTPGLTSNVHAQIAAAARRDSAAVTIVTNSAPLQALREVVSVTEPTVRIGAVSGGHEFLFSRIRGVIMTESGHIAVANGEPQEIRIFDAAGKFVNRLGRAGQGPGEFSYLGGLSAARGDTIIATNRDRVLRFTITNGFVDAFGVPRDRIVQALPVGMVPAEGVRGIFADSSFFLAARIPPTGVAMDGDQYQTGVMFREMVNVFWFNKDLTTRRFLGEMGQIQQMFVAMSDGNRAPVLPLFVRFPISASGGGGGTARLSRFCFAAAEGPELRCVDSDGRLMILRWAQAEVRVTREEVEEWRRQQRSGARNPADAERIIQAVKTPETRPAVRSIIIDRDRNVFVAGPDLATPRTGYTRYRVFNNSGQIMGVADLPGGTMHITSSRLVRIMRDADGVEFVHMHSVTR